MTVQTSPLPPTAESGRRVDVIEDRLRLSIRASLLDALIASRSLTGVSVTTAEDIGKLDLMFKHLTGETVAYKGAA